MRERKRPPTVAVWLLGLTLLVGGGYLILYGIQSEQPPSAAPNVSTPYVGVDAPPQASAGATEPAQPDAHPCTDAPAPGRIVISDVCVNADISPSGIDDAELLIPKDVSTVGMWSGSATISGPGADQGTVLIAGHVDDKNQGPGALYRLHQVQAGALVSVSDANGNTTTWRITTLEQYDKTALPQDLFNGPEGQRSLVIVTCGGEVIQTTNYGAQYESNAVVVALST